MLNEFFTYKLVPPFIYTIVALQLLTALCMMFQYKAQSRQDLGWEPASSISRNLMFAVALWLVFRAICLLREGQITANVILLTLSMFLWRANSLREYWLTSRRHAHRNVQANAQAREHLIAKGKLAK